MVSVDVKHHTKSDSHLEFGNRRHLSFINCAIAIMNDNNNQS